MNDLDLLDRFGPQPTDPSATVMDAARARLDVAMSQAAAGERRSRRRLPLLVAAAAAAVGLAVSPALVGSDESVALAAVDPLTFPLTPAALPAGLGDPVFERDSNFMAARYGPVLNGVSIVTDVQDEDFWSIPDNAPTAEVNGHQATVISRTVHNGTPDSAPAVTVIWHSDDHDWTAVTGSGNYADAGRVGAIAESLRQEPQQVDLALSVAPKGWSVVAYKEDRILTLQRRVKLVPATSLLPWWSGSAGTSPSTAPTTWRSSRSTQSWRCWVARPPTRTNRVGFWRRRHRVAKRSL